MFSLPSAALEWGRQFVNGNVSVEPWEVSLLWLLWYVHSAGGVLSIYEDGGAAQVSTHYRCILARVAQLRPP